MIPPEDGLSSSTLSLVSGVHPSSPVDKLAQILVGTALHLITFKEFLNVRIPHGTASPTWPVES